MIKLTDHIPGYHNTAWICCDSCIARILLEFGDTKPTRAEWNNFETRARREVTKMGWTNTTTEAGTIDTYRDCRTKGDPS